MEPGSASRIAVTNTTPLIGLVETGALTVLTRLFDRVRIPGAVWTELNDKPDAPEPAAIKGLACCEFDPGEYPIPSIAARLGAGERHALAIAFQIKPTLILLDEHKARSVATQLGLRVIGTVGLLVEAKRLGILPAVEPCIDKLIARKFRLSEQVINAALRAAGECS
jgi:uncharacterized protein